MTVNYLEFTQRFAVFDEAAFLNYARTFGDVVEDNHERKLIAGVTVIAGNGPHPRSRAESKHGYFLDSEQGSLVSRRPPNF
jgi:hypothetical protein